MNYRHITDPHYRYFEWRVCDGVRQFRWSYAPDSDWGFPGNWTFSPQHFLFRHTPERLVVWADLALNPFEL